MDYFCFGYSPKGESHVFVRSIKPSTWISNCCSKIFRAQWQTEVKNSRLKL